MNRNPLRLLIVTLCCAFTLAAFAAPAGDDLTVGDFVVRLARSLDSGDARIESMADARQALSRQGIALPAGIDGTAPLTEAAVTNISSSLGLTVTSDEPEKNFDADAVDGYIGFLREELADGRLSPQAAGTEDDAVLETGIDEALGGGACCKAGVCTIETRVQCQGSGGLFRGGMTSCVPDPCVAGAGTCCIAPNVCVIRTAAACFGFFQGTTTCKRKTCRLFDIKDPGSPTEP